MSIPKLRFKADNGSNFPEWEEKTLNEVLFIDTQTNNGLYTQNDILSVSDQFGVINQLELQGRSFAGESIDNYKIVKKGQIVYTRSPLKAKPYGIIKVVGDVDGIVSPLYIVNGVRPNNEALFVYYYFDTPTRTNNYLKPLVRMGAKHTMNISNAEWLSGTVFIPSLSEQKKIAKLFSSLDNVIKKTRDEITAWEKQKRGIMQLLFCQKMRFKADDGSEFPEWEKSLLGSKVNIQRGGSPRPIDAYITDDENGLNWIKIGDASPDNNIITATAEKIKPEGLFKTRQVFKGDLILSNSMSYGRPYIVAIDGCIHDGWLLIRDEHKSFNLKYLCYLLACESVIHQYEILCAGSAVKNLNVDIARALKINVPSIREQQKIAACLSGFDNVINKAKKELEEYKKLKKGLLQQMFV